MSQTSDDDDEAADDDPEAATNAVALGVGVLGSIMSVMVVAHVLRMAGMAPDVVA